MPEHDRPQYNPLIMGFVRDQGPMLIPLQQARETYGRLPSEYQLVPLKNGRRLKKALNLDLGKTITARLQFGHENLKKRVVDFFQNWHRSYEDEFGIHITPFLNLNEPARVTAVIDGHRDLLGRLWQLDIRRDILHAGLIRKDVLNSIPRERLAETVPHILTKKLRQVRHGERAETIRKTLSEMQAYAILQGLKRSIGLPGDGFTREMIDIYADDVAAALNDISRHLKLAGIENLQVVRGQGTEFQFAPRDISYLTMGKETGDCTADKPLFQADQDVENIYWTVFPWILDRNYQILKIYFDGDFIMKCHILPLFWLSPRGERMILAVDAIETARAFRDDMQRHSRDELLAQRTRILSSLLAQVCTIAGKMGIDAVYAEKFSNTPWVRVELSRMPEILLNVHQLIKLDELEDVYELARTLSRESGPNEVRHVFMELQMKNTSLQPGVTKRMDGIKSFAVVRGDPADGIPMKQVIGI